MRKVFKTYNGRDTLKSGGRRVTCSKGTYPVTKVADVLPKGAEVIGPFPGTTTPSRPGPYRREIPGKGQFWSYFNGRHWGMMGRNLKRAIARKDRPSGTTTNLPWFGISAPAKA